MGVASPWSLLNGDQCSKHSDQKHPSSPTSTHTHTLKLQISKCYFEAHRREHAANSTCSHSDRSADVWKDKYSCTTTDSNLFCLLED